MSLDPADSLPPNRFHVVDRTYYDRADAAGALSFHVNKMLQHLRHAQTIVEEFQVPVELPDCKRALLELDLRCGIIRCQTEKEKS